MTEVTHIGTCSAISEKKGGWHQIEISVPGKQYPVKADTKLEPLINSAREMLESGQAASWTIDETESENINPRSGKPYTERRLNKVEALTAEAAAASAAASSGPEPHHEPIHFADKDRAISRMACLKSAAMIVPLVSVLDDDGVPVPDAQLLDPALEVMKIAQRFERWIYRDIDSAPFE